MVTTSSPRRWLLLVHVLPPTPSNLRVRTWRRLQQLGAVAVKQSVYVLPDSPTAREDFEWLKSEIEGAGGEATVFAADSVDKWSDDALVEEFRRSRQAAYAELAQEAEQVLRTSGSGRRRGAGRSLTAMKQLTAFRQRLAAIEQVDFFGSAGRDRVIALLERLERASAPPEPERPATAGRKEVRSYRDRLWVTRPRPGVDRMASAWFIRRFVDSGARFGFVPDAASRPADAIPFDMFGVEFTHHGDHCTFETLCETFGTGEAGLAKIGAIVHDLDLKDARFGAPETPTIAAIIEGLQLACEDDDQLLERGIVLFEALYRSLGRPPVNAARPRPDRSAARRVRGYRRVRRRSRR